MNIQMGLSRTIEEVLSQTSDFNSFVDRMRIANRRLTGSTGEMPTAIGGKDANYAGKAEALQEPPLMVRLSSAVELLNAARSDLGAEISYFENLAETATQPAEPKAYAATGRDRA